MKENFLNNLPMWISAGKMMSVASKLEAHKVFWTVGRNFRKEIANTKGRQLQRKLGQDCYMGTQR